MPCCLLHYRPPPAVCTTKLPTSISQPPTYSLPATCLRPTINLQSDPATGLRLKPETKKKVVGNQQLSILLLLSIPKFHSRLAHKVITTCIIWACLLCWNDFRLLPHRPLPCIPFPGAAFVRNIWFPFGALVVSTASIANTPQSMLATNHMKCTYGHTDFHHSSGCHYIISFTNFPHRSYNPSWNRLNPHSCRYILLPLRRIAVRKVMSHLAASSFSLVVGSSSAIGKGALLSLIECKTSSSWQSVTCL